MDGVTEIEVVATNTHSAAVLQPCSLQHAADLEIVVVVTNEGGFLVLARVLQSSSCVD
jgi:hypothetical protein